MNKWYQLSINEIYEKLKTNESGLSLQESESRLKKNGKNELPKMENKSIFEIFFSQFLDSIVIVMIIAALFSFAVGETLDALVILFIILLDAIMGTAQEWSAQNSSESLRNMIKSQSVVIRDGKEIEIDSKDLVVGDIVLLQSGDKVASDARIISCTNLTVDEATLTGESIASTKHNQIIKEETKILDTDNMLFAGTNINSGRVLAVVVNTGINTEIGKIATEVSALEDARTPLTIRMDKFSKQISFFILIIAIFLIIILFAKNYTFNEVFLSVIALAVSAMPEGLPLALTLALTIGSNRMAKKNIIVKKLKAVESLGSTTVIASDKTGTLTLNEQTAKKIVLPNDLEYEISGIGYNNDGKIIGNDLKSVEQICKLGVINNEAILEKGKNTWISRGDSIDIAFLALGFKANIDLKNITRIGTIPYESENKYSAVFYKENNKNYITVKGSIDIIINFCDLSSKEIKKILSQNEQLASSGYRVIALASGENKNFKIKDFYTTKDIPKLTFEGLVAFIDPIRKEAISAIKESQNAGIKVVMITGDHPLTAFSIAKELELTSSYNEVCSGEDIDKYLKKSPTKFDEFIKSKIVFTRVTPIQKLKIVESFKRSGEFVAVTGDGVNDAPAIKSANLGIAMGSGTDVAKDTATMIITDDNFMSIVAGIKEGRIAFANIRKVIYMLISCGIAEVSFFILSILMNLPMPLIAIQLLWLNVVTDGLQDLALSFEKGEKQIMRELPRNPKDSVFDKLLIQEVLLAGISIGLIVFGVWIYLIKGLNLDTTIARGYIMTLMVFMQNIHVLNCRSEKQSAFKMRFRDNKLIIGSIIGAIILQIIIMESPTLANFMQISNIPWIHLLYLFLCSIPILFIMEIFKKIKFPNSKK